VDIVLLVKAAILGIVEGLTEFLPISSTGHLILASSLLEFRGEHVPTFEIAIQTGAMFAVMWEYRARLIGTVAGILRDATAQRFALNVAVAFVPAVVLGLAFGSMIKARLFHPVPVATAFVVGGLIILWVERRHHRRFGERDLQGQRLARVPTVDDMSALDALKVGLVQCVALIPGMSRSGSTIIGGMLFFVLVFATGYLAGGRLVENRRAVALMTCIRNAPIGMAIASQVFAHEPDVLVVVTMMAVMTAVLGLIATVALRRLAS